MHWVRPQDVRENSALARPGVPWVPKGRLNFRASQISGLVTGEELTVLDKLLLEPGLGNQVGLSVEPLKRLIERMESCAVPPGTRSFPLAYPALPCRALDCSVPAGLVPLLR